MPLAAAAAAAATAAVVVAAAAAAADATDVTKMRIGALHRYCVL